MQQQAAASEDVSFVNFLKESVIWNIHISKAWSLITPGKPYRTYFGFCYYNVKIFLRNDKKWQKISGTPMTVFYLSFNMSVVFIRFQNNLSLRAKQFFQLIAQHIPLDNIYSFLATPYCKYITISGKLCLKYTNLLFAQYSWNSMKMLDFRLGKLVSKIYLQKARYNLSQQISKTVSLIFSRWNGICLTWDKKKTVKKHQ